jgi:O-antigen/teichoic acid export membrane protein
MKDLSVHQNNKRIAKNTLLLYFRMLITMCVGLYTSRVVLNALGVNDYGVYNVVGGVVAMFSLFTNSLSAAISRFFAFALGKQDEKQLNSVFSTSVSIQLIMATAIVFAAEILGFLFLNRLNIPADRFEAAHWVFHFAILSFAINVVSVPYNAAIVAHEKMSAFAYISILEAVLKLIIAFVISVSSFDKLITYALLMVLVAIIIRATYGIYCRINFQECRYRFNFDRAMLKEMSGFAGWNFFGSAAYLFNTQGVNIVTNLFFGVATNAARGITNQVEGVVKQFVSSFTIAINPQITKSYAAENLDYMHSLVCRGAKFSYLLMLFFVVPLMFEAETVLSLWLKNFPPEATLFLKLSLVGTMFDMLGNSTANAAWATGNIKRYYIIVSSVGCLVFPISWICFALGCDAYFAYIVFAVVYAIVMLVKVYIIKDLVKFPTKKFYTDVLFKIFPTTVISFILPFISYYCLKDYGLYRFFVVVAASVISVMCSILALGLSKGEREAIVKIFKEKISYVIS